VENVPLKRRTAWLLGPLLVAAGACGPKVVEGSLGEVLNLTYQDVKLNFSGSQVAVRWTRPRGAGEDEIIAVSEKFDGLTVRTGDKVNLAEILEPTDGGFVDLDAGTTLPQRGLVTRDVFNDPRKEFPSIGEGFMVLYDVPRDGGTASGSFSVTFARCVDFGCGRTLFGDFKATVQ
jgi:hypothetical protein